MHKLLVTGGSGLLGNQIVKSAKRSFEVIPIHNTKSLDADSLSLNIANAREVSKLLAKLEPDAVIHTASETNVDKCETQKEHAWRANVDGARNIAVACQEANAKLVYISTDYVFDGERGCYKEKDKTNPINYYGLTKLEGEHKVTRLCKNYAILRTSVIYGWHPWKQNFATWVVNQLRQKREITVVTDHFNTPTLADNLAEMAIETASKDLQGLYHASGCERISRFEFATQIAETFNLESKLIKPMLMDQLAAWIAKRPKDSSLNTDKIQKHLKTKPLNITEGLCMMKQKENKT